MRLQILDLAKDDLIRGYRFYEEREPGLGSYFLDSLYSDIDSLSLFGGIHRKAYKGFIGLFQSDSHLRFITRLRMK